MPSQFSFGFPELLLASRLAESGSKEIWCLELALADGAVDAPFLIAAGLEQALVLLEDLALGSTDLAVLQAEPGPAWIDATLDADALAKVGTLGFHGDVEAVPEGTVLFAGEPLLRVHAQAPEAAAVGQAIASLLRSQTAVATALARLRIAAGAKPVYESAGTLVAREEALLVARAAQIGGAAGTTQPLAAGALGLPALPIVPFSGLVAMGGQLRGLQGCAIELDGPAARNPCAALSALAEPPRALVIPAGRGQASIADFSALRTRLTAQGLTTTQLLAGGCEDPRRLIDLADGVDGFVVGRALLSGRGRLFEALPFELVERQSAGPIERRDGGHGVRAVWRRREMGKFCGDTVQSATQAPPSRSAPLLVPMMRGGKRLFHSPSLPEIRVLCESQLSMFAPEMLTGAARYPVVFLGDAGPVQSPAASREASPPQAELTPAEPQPDVDADAGAVEPLPVAIQPVADVAPPPRLIDQVDDSADFTLVSNAFASAVTRHLGLPPEPMAAPAGAGAKPVQVAPPPPAIESPEPATVVDVPAPTLSSGPTSNVAAAPVPAAPASTAANPLLAAAARLRAIQRGETVAPAAAIALQSAAPPAPAAAAEPTSTPSDPLLAAAARLRKMRGG